MSLEFSKSRGNDLTRDYPEYNFKGLKDGEGGVYAHQGGLKHNEVGLVQNYFRSNTYKNIGFYFFTNIEIINTHKIIEFLHRFIYFETF